MQGSARDEYHDRWHDDLTHFDKNLERSARQHPLNTSVFRQPVKHTSNLKHPEYSGYSNGFRGSQASNANDAYVDSGWTANPSSSSVRKPPQVYTDRFSSRQNDSSIPETFLPSYHSQNSTSQLTVNRIKQRENGLQTGSELQPRSSHPLPASMLAPKMSHSKKDYNFARMRAPSLYESPGIVHISDLKSESPVVRVGKPLQDTQSKTRTSDDANQKTYEETVLKMARERLSLSGKIPVQSNNDANEIFQSSFSSTSPFHGMEKSAVNTAKGDDQQVQVDSSHKNNMDAHFDSAVEAYNSKQASLYQKQYRIRRLIKQKNLIESSEVLGHDNLSDKMSVATKLLQPQFDRQIASIIDGYKQSIHLVGRSMDLSEESGSTTADLDSLLIDVVGQCITNLTEDISRDERPGPYTSCRNEENDKTDDEVLSQYSKNRYGLVPDAGEQSRHGHDAVSPVIRLSISPRTLDKDRQGSNTMDEDPSPEAKEMSHSSGRETDSKPKYILKPDESGQDTSVPGTSEEGRVTSPMRKQLVKISAVFNGKNYTSLSKVTEFEDKLKKHDANIENAENTMDGEEKESHCERVVNMTMHNPVVESLSAMLPPSIHEDSDSASKATTLEKIDKVGLIELNGRETTGISQKELSVEPSDEEITNSVFEKRGLGKDESKSCSLSLTRSEHHLMPIHPATNSRLSPSDSGINKYEGKSSKMDGNEFEGTKPATSTTLVDASESVSTMVVSEDPIVTVLSSCDNTKTLSTARSPLDSQLPPEENTEVSVDMPCDPHQSTKDNIEKSVRSIADDDIIGKVSVYKRSADSSPDCQNSPKKSLIGAVDEQASEIVSDGNIAFVSASSPKARDDGRTVASTYRPVKSPALVTTSRKNNLGKESESPLCATSSPSDDPESVNQRHVQSVLDSFTDDEKAEDKSDLSGLVRSLSRNRAISSVSPSNSAPDESKDSFVPAFSMDRHTSKRGSTPELHGYGSSEKKRRLQKVGQQAVIALPVTITVLKSEHILF
eukprot:CFRG4964T1